MRGEKDIREETDLFRQLAAYILKKHNGLENPSEPTTKWLRHTRAVLLHKVATNEQLLEEHYSPIESTDEDTDG